MKAKRNNSVTLWLKGLSGLLGRLFVVAVEMQPASRGIQARLLIVSILVMVASLSQADSQRPLLQSDLAVDDVKAQLSALRIQGEWLAARPGDLPVSRALESGNHFQGIYRAPYHPGGENNVLYVTRSGDQDDSDNPASLAVIRLGSRYSYGERFRSNLLKKGAETSDTFPWSHDEVVNIVNYYDYRHPGGIQMAGDILAVPLEQPDAGKGLPPSRIVFYDCSDPLNPVEIEKARKDIWSGTTELDGAYKLNNAVSVGLTKLEDGHFLLMVALWSGKNHLAGHDLIFYRSTKTDILDPDFSWAFHDIWSYPENDFFNLDSPWPENWMGILYDFPFNTLQFVKQSDGRLFAVASSNSSGATARLKMGFDYLRLFEVTGFGDGEDIHLTEVQLPDEIGGLITTPGDKTYSEIHGNFNAGGAVYVSPSGELLYYAIHHFDYPLDTDEPRRIRMAEFRHEDVKRDGSVGPMVRKPHHLGSIDHLADSDGNFEIDEGATIQLDGTVFVVGPWVDMFRNLAYSGRSQMMDWIDRQGDDYKDFRKLDGSGRFGAAGAGFDNQLQSFRWAGASDDVLRIYQHPDFGGDILYESAGNGSVQSVRLPLLKRLRASSAKITRGEIRAEYAWSVSGPGLINVTQPNYDPAKATFEAQCGSSTNTVQLDYNSRSLLFDTQVTVNNVLPTLESAVVSPDPVAGPVEGAEVRLVGSWHDACASRHEVKVDWGDGTIDYEYYLPSTEGEFDLTHAYGDNGTYTIKITVGDETVSADDADAPGTRDAATAEAGDILHPEVTIVNLDPVATLDTGTATLFSGGLAFTGRIGMPQSHDASAEDEGSDDLGFVWTAKDEVFGNDFDFGITTYYNNGVSPDPLPSSQGVFPFSASDTGSVTFGMPGVYTIVVTVTDDDGGSDGEQLPKLVVGDETCTRSHGLWRQQFSKNGRHQVDDDTLKAYLAIINFASSRFSGLTFDAARAILKPGGAEVGGAGPSNMKGKAVQDLLVAWLNVASGSVSFNEALNTLYSVESVLNDANSNHRDFVEVKQTLWRISDRGCGM